MDEPKKHIPRQVDGPLRPRPVPSISPSVPGPTQVPAASLPVRPSFSYKRPRKAHSWRRRVVLSVLGLLLVAILFFGVKLLLASHKIISRNTTSGAPALAGNVDPTKLKGEGDGRINILLLGVGGPGHDGPYLSDTMMLMSIDPRTKDVAMLSIPRDLWVPIPGYGYAKINAADSYGEAYKYPGGGGALAKATVSKVFDIPVHYYIRVDFTAFKDAVNAVGGVDVVVDKPLYDPYYPLGETGKTTVVNISAGPHHMNGDLALEFARSRETTSDFDRAARQQKILVALREKALSLQTLSNPVKVSELIDSVGNHVTTDLQPNELQKLATMAKDIDPSKVIQKVLDTSPDGLLVDGNIGGGYVEIPKAGQNNFDELRAFVHSIFIDHYLQDENAAIQVQNGTTKSGLATTVANLLKSYNYNVIGAATADRQDYVATQIIDYTDGKKPYTINYLENRFGVKAQKQAPQQGDPDIRIILGADYKPSTR